MLTLKIDPKQSSTDILTIPIIVQTISFLSYRIQISDLKAATCGGRSHSTATGAAPSATRNMSKSGVIVNFHNSCIDKPASRAVGDNKRCEGAGGQSAAACRASASGNPNTPCHALATCVDGMI